MGRLRASFKGKSLGGWLMLLAGIVWSAVDHLSRLQFVIDWTRKAPDVSGWLRDTVQVIVSAVSGAIGAVWSPFAFQSALIIAGFIWLFISTQESAPPEQVRPDLSATKPAPKPKAKDGTAAIKFAATRLARFLEEGEALFESNADTRLVVDWEARAGRFIRAAYGDDEVARFLNTDDARLYSLHDHVQWRLSKISELGRRLEFTKVRDDFDPAIWTET